MKYRGIYRARGGIFRGLLRPMDTLFDGAHLESNSLTRRGRSGWLTLESRGPIAAPLECGDHIILACALRTSLHVTATSSCLIGYVPSCLWAIDCDNEKWY